MEQNEAKVLNFEQNACEVLTLEELQQTHREDYPDGTPVGDIYHHQLMSTILEQCDKDGLRPELKEIFAVNNRHKRSPGVTVLPEIAESKGVGSLESHILRRVFCNITLHGDFENERNTYNIAVSYTQQGILVGFGPFTYACHNQTICWPECLISNYTLRGNGRMETKDRDIKVLINTIREKIHTIMGECYKEIEQLERLMDFTMRGMEIDELIGMLVRERVACETENAQIRMTGYASLNSAHINMLAEKCMLEGYYDGTTAYNVYQSGTQFMKPRLVPFENICPQSLAMFRQISKFAGLKV